MGKYYLLDHGKNQNWYTSRNNTLVGIVVHCTAGLEDLDMQGIDHSAEQTAEYAANTTRSVSWHSGSDSDSMLELLPASYTAWHCRGYNSTTYGHEISKADMTWADEPADWVTATLGHAAEHLANIAKAHGIPLRHISKSQLDSAIAAGDPSMGGFVGHRQLDPTRRSDPGADFPWDRFIKLMTNDKGLTMADIEDIIARLDKIENQVTRDNLIEAARKGAYQTRTNIGGHETSVRDDVLERQVQLHELWRRTRVDASEAHRKAAEALAIVEELAKQGGINEDDLAEVKAAVSEALASGVNIKVSVDDGGSQ